MQLRYPFVFSGGRSAVVRRSVSVSLAALMLTGGIVALSGCGADSDDNDPYAFVSTTAAPYTSRDYTTAVTLADGTTGTLVARVLADGTAQGTFTPDATAARSRVVINTPFLNGTFNPQTGAINVAGSYTVNGETINLSINGVLPVPPATSGGSLTYAINGENFNSTWTVSLTNPSVNPSPGVTPSPSASASPGSGGSSAIGGTQSLVFTNIDSNADLANLPTTNIAGARQTSSSGTAVSVSVVQANGLSYGGRAFTAVVLDSTGAAVGPGPIAVRDIYDYTSANIARSISFSYVETQTAGSVARYFVAKSGTVDIVSSSASQITLKLTNVRLEPLSIYPGSSGAFTVSGEVTANIQ